jgi:hypothetical protein
MNEMKWSKTEKSLARKAFDLAYARECAAIAAKLKEKAAASAEPEHLWRIHDYLTEKRRETDEKYDYRYSVLISVFARLLMEGWLKEAELQGLQQDKIDRIKYLAGMTVA